MNKKFVFSDKEKSLIETAIQDLEKESSGEVVVFFAKQSDSYIETCFKTSAIIGFFLTIVFSFLSYNWLLLDVMTPFINGLIIVVAMIISGLTPFVFSKIRLVFTSRKKIKERVLSRARDMFLQHEVFKTIDRTGILIYISKFENRVQVLGDEGINSKISQKDWEYVVGLVLNGIKNNKPAEGLVQAIDACK